MSVTRIPISFDTRLKNLLGQFAVPCQVTDRWLRIAPSSALLASGEFITIDVMTGHDSRRCLTRVIVTREDLLNVLANVTPPAHQ